MADIEITLLNNKQTHSEYGNTILTSKLKGYTVVAGEDCATEIKVKYPEAFTTFDKSVYMKNALGEYSELQLKKYEQGCAFKLPASMTFAGITTLVFYAKGQSETTVWLPVEIPIAATNVNYKKVAMASPDVLQEAISAVAEMREFLRKHKE